MATANRSNICTGSQMNIRIPKPWRSSSHRSQANPELKNKKQTLLVDIQGRKSREVMKTSAGEVLFENGLAVLPNDGRGDEIAAELNEQSIIPDRFGVHKHRPSVNTNTIHRYFFGSHPAMPWAMYDELGRRIKDD